MPNRLALFAAEIGWQDVTKLVKDRRTQRLSDQLYRALGSIGANLAEGYSRGSNKDRARFYEYALGIKADYTITWPVRWRIGVAEGLSYSSQISYVERTELEAKGYRPSKLLNYLDFTVDINVGDIFSAKSLRNTYFGYSIHHRSGIFETGSQFGRIKGGSNYTTLYLQQPKMLLPKKVRLLAIHISQTFNRLSKRLWKILKPLSRAKNNVTLNVSN